MLRYLHVTQLLQIHTKVNEIISHVNPKSSVGMIFTKNVKKVLMQVRLMVVLYVLTKCFNIDQNELQPQRFKIKSKENCSAPMSYVSEVTSG